MAHRNPAGLDVNCSGALSVTEVKQAFAEASLSDLVDLMLFESGFYHIPQEESAYSVFLIWLVCQKSEKQTGPPRLHQVMQEILY